MNNNEELKLERLDDDSENRVSQKENGSLAQIRTEVAGSRVPHD